MGILSSRWEADHQGHHFTVTRSEVTRGFTLEYDGRLVDKRSWSLIGVGDLEGTIELDGRSVKVHVTLFGRLPFSNEQECEIKVDGQPIPVRTTA